MDSPFVHYGQVLWVLSALSASIRLNIVGGITLGLTLLISLGRSPVTGSDVLETGSVVAIHGLTLAFGVLIAVAMQRYQAWMSHWQEQAHTDHLTGLANRPGWLAWWQRIAPTKGWLRVMDLNNFKALNDTYGHERGDQVLAAVAEELSNALPTEAFAARIGGDEFLIYLPGGQTESEAGETVRRLTLRAGQAVQLPVTAALGLVQVTPGHCDFQELYRRADAHMYEQKQTRASFTVDASTQSRT
ncbi:GGDEF domain-containing protein [Marinococcus luteus]|uniref:GGDEF domain-containing protein n=1 Tax=Marinococcus luteus TaxID=1122204 RepID=UPI0015A2B52E|nr:GGDEF domain-containing protein [Marinococcus luteus]